MGIKLITFHFRKLLNILLIYVNKGAVVHVVSHYFSYYIKKQLYTHCIGWLIFARHCAKWVTCIIIFNSKNLRVSIVSVPM